MAGSPDGGGCRDSEGTAVKWSILIPTIGYRQSRFLGLVGMVLSQITGDDVEIVALHNNGEKPVGVYRQVLLDAARGEYVSFIDDDDAVADDYVPVILAALEAGPDVVGFETIYTRDGGLPVRVLNSIVNTPRDDWAAGVLYRDLTHVQPVRADLARIGDFSQGWPEDFTWRGGVRPHVKAEVYLDRVLYYYRHSSSDSVQAGMLPNMPKPGRVEIDSPHFRYVEA
jgi:glycosyltransferase involved in cell wall biosynthesis